MNYLYAIAQTGATLAAQRMGFDPTLGLMHTDKRYRPSLAADLMEPVQPVAGRIAFELWKDREFSRGEVVAPPKRLQARGRTGAETGSAFRGLAGGGRSARGAVGSRTTAGAGSPDAHDAGASAEPGGARSSADNK